MLFYGRECHFKSLNAGFPPFSLRPKITAHKLFVEMPKRNPINNEQQPPTNLRRSPRFLHNHFTDPEFLKTPKTKSSRERVIPPKTPSFSSTPKVSAREVGNSCPEKGSERVNEANVGRKGSVRPNIGSRRSARLIGRVEEFSYVELSPIGNVEKRLTRSSMRAKANSDILKSCNGKLEKKESHNIRRGTTNQFVQKPGDHESTKVLDKGCKLDGHETSDFHEGKAGKCTQKSGHEKCDGFDECVYDEVLGRGALSTAVVKEGGVKADGGNNDEGQLVGFKRKRDPVEKCHGIVHGWSKDQELALDRAYFATKPTPQFWKKVARLVPGKSAQDCFNKVHSDHMTPPQPQPRSRAKRLSSPPNSLSASKLLNSSGPIIKKPTHRKKSRHLVQKTVRHLLQKQCQVDQNSEEDLFSVLEPRTSPSVPSIQQDLIITTPDSKKQRFDFLRKCRERSSSAKKKSLSRFSTSKGTNLVSPLVLKQVKNKALHEKYVDLLHCREANRKAVCVKEAKLHKGKGVKEEGRIQKTDAIKAAKDALVFDASDAIKQFQDLQANALMSSFSDDDDDGVDYDEDGEDVGL